jgi:hypothetical protein
MYCLLGLRKLRNRFTLDILYSAFGFDEADARDSG